MSARIQTDTLFGATFTATTMGTISHWCRRSNREQALPRLFSACWLRPPPEINYSRPSRCTSHRELSDYPAITHLHLIKKPRSANLKNNHRIMKNPVVDLYTPSVLRTRPSGGKHRPARRMCWSFSQTKRRLWCPPPGSVKIKSQSR